MIKKIISIFKCSEYIIFSYFFVFYPFFKDNGNQVFSLSWFSIIITALFCYWLILTSSQDRQIPVPLKKISLFNSTVIIYTIITLIVVFVNMLFWTFLSNILNVVDIKAIIFDLKITNFGQGICLVLQIASVAGFEELFFRQFLPLRGKTILHIVRLKNAWVEKHYFKIKMVIVEIVPVLFFALGHVYLGIIGFCNAFIAGIFLRMLYKKAHSVIPGFIMHTVYNLILISVSLL